MKILAYRPVLRALTGLLLLGVLAAGCSESKEASAPPSASGPAQCTLSELAVPSCGVLWGVATKPPTMAQVRVVEGQMGRPFDFVYRYHDVNDVVPDKDETAAAASGKLLHIALAARDFADKSDARIPWSEVAEGKFDEVWRRQAQGVASLKVPVFMTYEQEANQKAKVGTKGTPAEFIAGWRRLHKIYQEAGATNAIWTWVMTGSEDNLSSAGQLWPGNEYVDWISWNVYNQSGCKTNKIEQEKFISFEDKLVIFYNFIKEQGPELGIDPNKPMMISETGSAKYPDDPERTAQWYADIPGALAKYPQIKAVGLWNSIDESCNYELTTVPEIRGGAQKAGRDPRIAVKGAVPHQ
ncbi:MAG: glycoside hydrolase family 26 protein [Angustibacter sp.]